MVVTIIELVIFVIEEMIPLVLAIILRHPVVRTPVICSMQDTIKVSIQLMIVFCTDLTGVGVVDPAKIIMN
jgi:hypothetical protein